MYEFDFIARCTEGLPNQSEGLMCGIGDDCAVFTGSTGRDWLLSSDTYVEGVHFCRDWMDPADIGRRCVTGAVSDIAAMGGRPRYLAIMISIPPTWSVEVASQVMAGMTTTASIHQMVVIGGDTTASPHELQIALTVIGDIRHGSALYRRGAKPGDVVYVTGKLGGSLAGLRMLQKNFPLLCKEGSAKPGEVETLPHLASPYPLRGPCVGEECIDRFLHPVARIASGQWLNDTGCVTSMIDVSDGLIQDLGHVARASNVGIVLEAEAIPRWSVTTLSLDLEVACTSGEEYELAFTVDGRRDTAFQRLLPAVLGQLGHSITRIGTVISGQGVHVQDRDGLDCTPKIGGFQHAIGRDA